MFCLIIILIILNEPAAQRANNWYFPQKKSLTFNTNPPSFIGNSQCFYGGAASISDNQGNLLFYSDARRVFNRNNQIMPNGINIKGASSFQVGSDQALIIPHPGLENLYYLFTNEANEGTLPTGYYYHLIDMNANGGLGDVVLKNQLLYSNSGMRMTAAPMADGAGVWFISMEYRKKILHNYKITCQGLNLTPVLDTLDANFIGDYLFDGGDIKASTTGNFIAFGNYKNFSPPGFGTTEIYKFNRLSGKTTSKVVIPIHSNKREFSPNDKYLYFGGNLNFNLYQFDISSFDSATINNNKIIIGQGTGIQLGPDGKIYVLNFGDTLFSFIEKPDLPYPSCNFVSRVIPIEGNSVNGSNSSFYGILPFFLPSLLANQNVQISTFSIGTDCRTVTFTGKTYIKGSNLTFKWKFGDGDSTVQVVPSMGDTTFKSVTHFFPLGIDTFNVQLFVTSDTVCGLGSIGKRLTLPKKSTIKANFGFQKSCGLLLVQFTDSSTFSNISNNLINYQWQFFNKNNLLLGTSTEKNPSFTFPNFDTVKVRLIVSVNSIEYCSKADTIEKIIVLFRQPNSSFTNSTICLGEQVIFNNTSNNVGLNVTTEWFINNTLVSNNSNGFSYTFNQAGNYTIGLKSTTANGCSNITTKNILVEPALANAGRDTTVLENQPFVLQGSGGATFFWQPPIGLDDITKANPTGVLNNNQQYVLRATTAQGCISFDTVVVTVLRNLKIPNAFSPNGDGINETWGIEQLKDYPNAVVQIFNRNGQLVCHAKGNNINAWNGTTNNQPVPVGTYYYVITLNNVLRKKPISGWVMVVR